jgi:hypothetical protein
MPDITDLSTTSTTDDVNLLSEGEEEVVETSEEVEPEEVEAPEEAEPEGAEADEEEEAPASTLHPFERPSIKQINEAFPDLFKKFPSLRDMYFREAAYSKVFPTIEEAQEAVENNEAFSNIREDIFSGDGSKFLSAVKEVNEKGLERFAANVLPSLVKTHSQAFWAAANPLVEDIARSMYTKGTNEKNEDLQNAARYLSQYFFGNTEVAEGKKTTVVEQKPTPVDEERQRYETERYTEFRSNVSSKIKSDLTGMIDNEKLDPKGVLSKFVKGVIIDRIVSDIGDTLQADKDHLKYMDSLWNRAAKNGRTDEEKARIVSAYLARAKSLIPSLRSKYVSEAMGTRSRVAADKKDKVSTIESRKDGGTMGRGSGASQRSYNSKSIDYSKTSDMDLINDEITYK